MPAPTREFLLQLLSDARIKGPQLDTAVSRALDPDYWRGLVPDLHIESAHASLECSPIDPAATEAAVRAQQVDGYFRLPGVIAPAGIRRLNDAINAIVAAGWPASFVFMYDEAWQAGRSPAVGRVLESILGPEFLQITHVWVHVVHPVTGATGWSPHVDGDPGARMSTWIGLTEATLDNGCMHVVPRTATSLSPDLVQRFRTSHSQFTRAEVASLLHATHALEAQPGDSLGWSFDLIHWGGYVRRAGHERRGLSFEFVAKDEKRGANDGPLIAMDTLPTFQDRVRYTAKAIESYRKFEPAIDRFLDVAYELTARLS